MRVRYQTISLAAAVVLLAAGAVPVASAQAPVPLEGSVKRAGSGEPVEGAIIDIYRTDIRGKYETKTDKKGNFTYPVPQAGTFVVIASGAGLAPQYEAGVRPTVAYKRIDFVMPNGNGARPTLEDVNRAIKGGGATADPEDAAKAAEEAAKFEKAKADKEKFDARKVRFDAGVAAMQSSDYPSAITELTAAIDGLEGADPQFFGELASVGGAQLAEVHYRVGADLYNKKERDQAKAHLEKAAKAITLSIQFNPASQVSYQIQGKVLFLLVDRFSMSDSAETGAKAFLKAAELETADPKKKVGFLVQAGNVYRAGYMTDQAIETYKQALASDPNNAEAYYGIGLAAMATATDDQAKQREYWQLAADYMKAFVDKLPSDPRVANEIKPLLDTLAKDYKIKPRSIK
jgi:tetratricopeptide (TPR) repeat protein